MESLKGCVFRARAPEIGYVTITCWHVDGLQRIYIYFLVRVGGAKLPPVIESAEYLLVPVSPQQSPLEQTQCSLSVPVIP